MIVVRELSAKGGRQPANYKGDVMLSQAISLERLRVYERECRRQAASATDSLSKAELTKLAETLLRRVKELELLLESSEGGSKQGPGQTSKEARTGLVVVS